MHVLGLALVLALVHVLVGTPLEEPLGVVTDEIGGRGHDTVRVREHERAVGDAARVSVPGEGFGARLRQRGG